MITIEIDDPRMAICMELETLFIGLRCLHGYRPTDWDVIRETLELRRHDVAHEEPNE